MDGGDTRILGLECRWCRIWMKVRHKSWDLNCIKMGPWRGWNSIYKTWMALRRHLDGVEKRILWPGLGWDATCMEVRWTSWSLDVYIWCLDGAGMQFGGPGSRWGTHLETCMGLRWCSDGAEMQFCGPEWRWDITEMEVKRKCRDLYWGETWSGWRDVNLVVWLEMIWKSEDLVGGEMGHGLSWDTHVETWVYCNGTREDLLFICGETCPGLWWDTNNETWLGMTWVTMRCECLYLDGI